MARTGRPKGSKNNPFKAALLAELRDAEGKLSKLREIGKVLVEKALEGDMAAIKEIADRTDGKPTQAVSGPNGGPVQMAIFDPAKLKDLSDKELTALEHALDTIGIQLGSESGEGEAD